MEMITVERNLLDDLIDTKLKVMTDSINSILENWHYDSIDQFLLDASNGILEEAEMDAISLTNLRDKRNDWYQKKKSWKKQE